MNVPEDFPGEPDPAALTGAQPKIGVRQIHGKYISGYTTEERAARYEMCADLVLQLVRYYERKKKERQDLTRAQLLSLIAEALPTKGRGLSDAEVSWCMRELTAVVSREKE